MAQEALEPPRRHLVLELEVVVHASGSRRAGGTTAAGRRRAGRRRKSVIAIGAARTPTIGATPREWWWASRRPAQGLIRPASRSSRSAPRAVNSGRHAVKAGRRSQCPAAPRPVLLSKGGEHPLRTCCASSPSTVTPRAWVVSLRRVRAGVPASQCTPGRSGRRSCTSASTEQLTSSVHSRRRPTSRLSNTVSSSLRQKRQSRAIRRWVPRAR